jgi:hypothetical protein
VLTSFAISLRIALAATPVVAVLKSKWLLPRVRGTDSGFRDMATGSLHVAVGDEQKAKVSTGMWGRVGGERTGEGGCGKVL